MSITREEIMGAVARGWCHPANESKVMDEQLAMAIAEEVTVALLASREPHLGYATTREMITELAARAEVGEAIGEKWPSYRSVP